ncbi:hypothetical protein CcCBS67573_g08112 [Chytriomyces confervae]|uniref:Uncharacterized protein n=1 Tax=Chytriomyces confervae TaxID=246404 RepID=A0A507EMH0_9FUNG|nr:hypothetical protein HDU80_003499 [Chytriomyces hyalinus]TPX65449.1 hypothetical protein CcCBS67573_g08112 [Chytriomyces confervae]
MRDGRLSAASRAMVLKSCGVTPAVHPNEKTHSTAASRVMLSDSVIPTSRSFKNYLPVSSDSTLFRSPLPRAYSPSGSPVASTENLPIHTTPIGVSEVSISVDISIETPAVDSQLPDHEDSKDMKNVDVEMRESATLRSSQSSTTPLATAMNESNCADSSATKPQEAKEPLWYKEFSHIDCEWSMRTMDALFNASFVEFIKNEKNCEFNGQHIAHMVKDYKLDQVVHGIKWLVDGWTIESTARVLKNVFDDWLPELAAFAIARIGSAWPLRPKMGLVVAFMMMGESPQIAALFIRSLTIGWDADRITELISCLDTVLEWEDKYFTKFSELLLAELNEASRVGEIQNVDPALIISALSSLYKQNATSTNHRIVMADLRMAVAKARYLTQFAHSISCQNCLNRRECNFTARATSPSPASVIAAMRNRIRPTGSTANTGLVIDSAGVLRPATGPDMRSGSADVGSLDSELDASSSTNFAYLLDRIPPALREFFGATDASTTHTEFGISSSDDLLFNSSLYDGTTDSQASDTFMESRGNSVMSMPSLHTASQFSRATSSNSFRLARGISLMNADESSNPPISLVPNTVFDAHHVPLENFRQATSLMSMALSTLDLVEIPDAFDARNGEELLNGSAMDAEDTISVADARRLIFSRGANVLASNSDGMSGSAAASAMARYQLSRGTSFQSVKSSDELTFEQL